MFAYVGTPNMMPGEAAARDEEVPAAWPPCRDPDRACSTATNALQCIAVFKAALKLPLNITVSTTEEPQMVPPSTAASNVQRHRWNPDLKAN